MNTYNTLIITNSLAICYNNLNVMNRFPKQFPITNAIATTGILESEHQYHIDTIS